MFKHLATFLSIGFLFTSSPFQALYAQSKDSTSNNTIFTAGTVFVPKVTYPSGGENWGVACGDINKDGKIDIVTTSRKDGKVNIHLNDGKGNFGKPYSYGTAPENRAICLFDANGDGWLDIATASSNPGQLSILLNDKTGRMGNVQSYSSGLMSHDVTAADINGDGKQDLLVPVVNENVIKIFEGDGSGKFKQGASIATGEKPRVVKVADIDANGSQDLLVGCDDDKVSIFYGEGGGKFKPKVMLRSGLAIWGLGIADLNGDGKLDIAAAAYQDGQLCVHINKGGGVFAKEACIPACSRNFELVIADFDLDKDLDIATCSTIDDNIGITPNDGKGSFSEMHKMKSGSWNAGIDIADFDGDTDPDLAVASIKDNMLNVHRNVRFDPKKEKIEPIALTGKIWDEEKNIQIKRAVTSVLDEKGNAIETKQLPADGVYKHLVAPNGKYQIQVRTVEFPVAVEKVEVAGVAMEKDIKLKLPQGGYVYGKVSDADTKKPVDGAKIVFTDEKGTVVKELTATSSGTYQQFLPFGNFTVTASADKYSQPSASFQIATINREAKNGVRQDLLMTRPKNPNMPDTLPKTQPKIKPAPKPKANCITGVVKNAKTMGAISDAKIILTDPVGFGETKELVGDMEGKFKTCPPFGEYKLNASAPGYFYNLIDVTTSEEEGGPKEVEILLTPLEIGEKITLKNIYFDTGKADLREESYTELDRLVKIMEDNPTLNVEIGGHTDSDGSDSKNKVLSQNRSQSVVEYLTMKNISVDRMKAEGYGETEPVAPNDTPENKQLNRRTEVKVIGF